MWARSMAGCVAAAACVLFLCASILRESRVRYFLYIMVSDLLDSFLSSLSGPTSQLTVAYTVASGGG